MAMVLTSGAMVVCTRVSGWTTRHMVRAYSGIALVTFILASSWLIRPMGSACTCISTGLCMRDTGLTISNTVKVRRPGKTAHAMLEATTMEWNTDMVYTLGLIRATTRVSGSKTGSTVTARTSGKMVESMKATGRIMTGMVKASNTGPTVALTKVNSTTTRSTDTVFTTTPTNTASKVNSKTIFNTARVPLWCPTARNVKVNGTKEGE